MFNWSWSSDSMSVGMRSAYWAKYSRRNSLFGSTWPKKLKHVRHPKKIHPKSGWCYRCLKTGLFVASLLLHYDGATAKSSYEAELRHLNGETNHKWWMLNNNCESFLVLLSRVAKLQCDQKFWDQLFVARVVSYRVWSSPCPGILCRIPGLKNI